MTAVMPMNNATNIVLQSIPGFEETNYAYSNGSIVWAGSHAITQHPRNISSPWQANTIDFNYAKLHESAWLCKSLFEASQPQYTNAKGLMLWFLNQDMPFPLNLSTARFDDIKRALESNDLPAFTTAAIRVLGLGNGLTPSGDDFVGGILFALAHSPRQSWVADLPEAKQKIQFSATKLTNVISAALLDDMMAGNSYSALHDLLVAMNDGDSEEIHTCCQKLMNIGASSGSDMLAGLLLALTTTTQTTRQSTTKNQNPTLQH